MKWPAALMLAAAALPLGACSGLYGDDEFARYVQRSDKITQSAGDPKDDNAVTHTLDPWSRGVHDRRISANGERMVHGIENYRRGPPALAPAAASGGAAAAPPAAAPAPPAAPTTGQ